MSVTACNLFPHTVTQLLPCQNDDDSENYQGRDHNNNRQVPRSQQRVARLSGHEYMDSATTLTLEQKPSVRKREIQVLGPQTGPACRAVLWSSRIPNQGPRLRYLPDRL